METPSHLSTLINRVREDEVSLGYATKEHLVNIAEYLLSWRGKFSGQEYSEAIKTLAKYHLAKLANIHPCHIKKTYKQIEQELSKKYVGRCMRCGLPISNPVSLAAGHGPICRKKLGFKTAESEEPRYPRQTIPPFPRGPTSD